MYLQRSKLQEPQKYCIRPKKKKRVFVCPFPTDLKLKTNKQTKQNKTKNKKTRVTFFSLLIHNFAFLNKFVKINFLKHIVTVPKVYCVGTEGVFTPFMSPPHCWMSLTEKLYDLYKNVLHFFNIQIKKKKKKRKRDRPTDPPNFQSKRANKPLNFQSKRQTNLYF